MIQYKIPIKKYKKYALKQKIRIVMLSDLHSQIYGQDNDILVSRIRELHPDLILVAGDMVNSEDQRNEEVALNLLICLAQEYRIFYANGNHEYSMKLDTGRYGMRYARYRTQLEEAGVTVLENEDVDIQVHGLPIRIYGLEIPWRFYRRICWARLRPIDIRRRLGRGTKRRYQILIAHNPMSFPAYAEWGADLTFSGHLHGGFFRLPVIGGVISPQMVPFPKYDRGVFKNKGHYLVVGAGLGSHSGLPRIGNPPEIVAVDLYQRKRKVAKR